MEQLLGMVTNEAIGMVAGALTSVFVGGIGVWLWVKLQLKKKATQSMEILGNYMGLTIYNVVLRPLKDQNLKRKMTEDLDESGGAFDAGWDKGIRGEKL